VSDPASAAPPSGASGPSGAAAAPPPLDPLDAELARGIAAGERRCWPAASR
jgi:hypothetical protein